MERRFAARRDQLLADAEADPRIPRGVLARLERFLDPFVELLQRNLLSPFRDASGVEQGPVLS